MPDFTSALYLGLRHGSRSLPPWRRLTLGAPAALKPPPGTRAVERRLAALVGYEAALLGTSTLHLFWDLFGMLSREPIAVYMDSGLYPVGRWGVERAAARGVPVRSFRHHDAADLRAGLRRAAGSGPPPVVVSDGFCPGCGRTAPIAAYLAAARRHGGLLILDDTQALGILGRSPRAGAPYGRGGGGSLRHTGAGGPDVMLISSLAKGFGAPLAILGGSASRVERFERRSETRMHCSPPSAAAVHAAERALDVNRELGDRLRWRLARNVRRFRERLHERGLASSGRLFPVQTLAPIPGIDAAALHSGLRRLGLRAVLHRTRYGRSARISFLLGARHQPAEIDRAADTLGRTLATLGSGSQPKEVDHDQQARARDGSLRRFHGARR